MAVDLFGPVNKIINQTVTQIVDDQLPKKTANAVNSFVSAIFDAVDAGLKKVQDITKEDTTPPTP
jgi:hypothetical protein